MNNWVKDMGVNWFICVVQDYSCVVIKVDCGFVFMMNFFCGVYDNGFMDVIFFNVIMWNGFFN